MMTRPLSGPDVVGAYCLGVPGLSHEIVGRECQRCGEQMVEGQAKRPPLPVIAPPGGVKARATMWGQQYPWHPTGETPGEWVRRNRWRLAADLMEVGTNVFMRQHEIGGYTRIVSMVKEAVGMGDVDLRNLSVQQRRLWAKAFRDRGGMET